MPGEPNPKIEPQKVIVVERRSLLADFAGIWLVAIPLFVALLICLPRKEQAESPRSELNLPATGWSRPLMPATSKSGKSADETAPALNTSTGGVQAPMPVKVNRVEISGQPREKPAAAEGDTAPGAEKPNAAEAIQMPRGVVVLNNSVNSLNPVAVFDPKQAGSGQPAAGENAGENRKIIAPDKKNLPEATKNDTAQALADIQNEANAAKNARLADEAIKPLLALHDAEKSRLKAEQIQESLRQRAIQNQRPFLASLASIIEGQQAAAERSSAIGQLMDDDLKGIDPRHFQKMLSELDTPGLKLSTASKIRRLRGYYVPESVILAYLTELEKRDAGKSRGSARNSAEAVVQASRLLLRNSADLLR